MFVDINKYCSSKHTIILIKGEISYHEKKMLMDNAFYRDANTVTAAI